jgi:hypothetical protein
MINLLLFLDIKNILDKFLIYLFEFDFELIQNQIQINKFRRNI